MPSDVRMFEKSGLSIAMGNASAEVQAQANFVTLSNEEDGFAYAMDNLFCRCCIRIRSLSHADETQIQSWRSC